MKPWSRSNFEKVMSFAYLSHNPGQSLGTALKQVNGSAEPGGGWYWFWFNGECLCCFLSLVTVLLKSVEIQKQAKLLICL